ncbi:ubiquitin-like domain-containing protein [Streptomyces sp. NPDC005805]|uniref:ubiquitin-like domain-containing protein n=1 Tax=Streptomyces sp. NPDC005805 TaxID=3157068 RepID=UPI0033D7E561
MLAGGTTAFVADDKAVRISVDGDSRTVRTFADDVAELLAEEAVTVASHDTVAPSPGAALADGDAIEIHRARPLALPPLDAPDGTAVESLLRRLRAQAGAD